MICVWEKCINMIKYDKTISFLKEHLERIATNILDVRAKLMPSNPSMEIRRSVCHKGIKKHMLGQIGKF